MDFDDFDHLAAKFIAAAVHSSLEDSVSLIFASPLSARSPDLCLLWHSSHRRKHGSRVFLKLFISVFSGCLKGIIRLTTNIRPLGYALYGKISDRILVITSTCGHLAPTGEYKTAYVRTERDDGLFVFGPIKDCGKNAEKAKPLIFKHKFFFMCDLIKSGAVAFSKIKGNLFNKSLLLLQWYSWALSLQWLYDYYLENSLSEVVQRYNIDKIGCIHEMHSYARVVWKVASKHHARGHTVQHAAITEGKRWYFPYPEEKEGGLIQPDVMYVFNTKVIELLRPYYENTSFILGCSHRYAYWKDVKIPEKKGRYYLFVGALAAFDNKTLVASLRRLIFRSEKTNQLRLRLHPKAELDRKEWRWLLKYKKAGLIEMSTNSSLQDDIANAIAVIGMSTTVLEEALLLNRPVIQLTHPEYLQYINIDGVRGAIKKDYRELCPDDLLHLAKMQVHHEKMREKLGLNHPIVTYERLFSV